MTRFIDSVNRKFRLELKSYAQLYNWSIENIPDFWTAMWDFGGILASRGYNKVVDDLSKFPGVCVSEGTCCGSIPRLRVGFPYALV